MSSRGASLHKSRASSSALARPSLEGDESLCCGRPEAAVDALLSRLEGGEKYHQLREVLREALAHATPSPARFVVSALTELSRHQAVSPSREPLFHLLLEALACAEVWARPPHVSEAAQSAQRCELAAGDALALLASCVAVPCPVRVEPRAVLRLVQTFRLDAADCDAPLHAACDAYAVGLLAAGAHTPAVLLALQLQLPGVAREGTLGGLLQANQEALAESLAERLGAASQRALVRLCLAQSRFRAAVRACRRFALSDAFPEAERLYTAATVAKLAAKGTWDVAAAIAERSRDSTAQMQLLQAALGAGEPGVAHALALRFRLAEQGVDVPQLLRLAEAAAVAESATYLPLAVDVARVLLVDSAQQLPAVTAALRGAPALGLDCEWRAECVVAADEAHAATGGRVALLQVATECHVFLFDLPLLAARCPVALSDALRAVLCRQGAAPAPLLLGVGVAADLHKCATDWPQVTAFASTESRPLDLRLAWRAARGEEPPPGGLAGAARVALGKLLDKRPRMSDWERRPLSAAQVTYAANDAHAALRIWNALTANLDERRRSAVVDAVIPRPRRDSSPADALDEASPALGTADVEAALCGGAHPWRLVKTSEEGATCASAALALRVPVRRIVKSLGLLADQTRILLLLAGDQRADLAAVARHLGQPRRALRFATAAECVSLFGFAPGSMPPVGHREGGVRTLMDALLYERADGEVDDAATLFAGAGASDMHLAMLVRDMRAAAGAELASIAVGPRAGPPGPPSSGGGSGESIRDVGAVESVVAPQTSALAFSVDGALGRLGRWLRCLGVDVAPSTHVASGAAADAPPRVLLTRSRTAVAHVGAASVFYVGDGDARAQLSRVRARFNLAFSPSALLSRCAACNGAVGTRRTAEQLADDPTVPGHVLRSVSEFWACDDCGKVYWVGPKSRRAVELAASLCGVGSVFGPLSETPSSPSAELAAQIADVMACAAAAITGEGEDAWPDAAAAAAS